MSYSEKLVFTSVYLRVLYSTVLLSSATPWLSRFTNTTTKKHDKKLIQGESTIYISTAEGLRGGTERCTTS